MFKNNDIGLLSITAFAGTVLAGCSKQDTQLAARIIRQLPLTASRSPVPLSVFMIGDPELDMNANKFTQEMNEKLNVKIEYYGCSNETA